MDDFYNKTKEKQNFKNLDTKELYDQFAKNGNTHLFNLKSCYDVIISEQVKRNCEQITIATSCMDRNEFLLNSLDTWLRLPFKKIVIVDWSSKEPVEDLLRDRYINDPRIEIHRVDGERYYEHSKVRNLKMSLCDGWVLSIDCDVMLSKTFSNFLHLPKDRDVFYSTTINAVDKSLIGTSLFTKELYDKAGGANENLHGWGSEDMALYDNMKKISFQRDIIHTDLFHQSHGDDLRVKCTRFDDKNRSLSSNDYKVMLDSFK